MNAVHIIGKGAEWYSAMGSEDSKGIKLFQISGPIARPGVYELPIGATFRELLYDLRRRTNRRDQGAGSGWVVRADAAV